MAKKATPKKRLIKGRDYNEDKRQDGLRSARAFGWRKAGTSRKPTKKEIQDHYDGVSNGVYMENRPERGDARGRAKKGERFEQGGEVNYNYEKGKNYPVKTVSKDDYEKLGLEDYPNFSKTGSISGMKKQYYGKDALLVKCGNYIYNVTSNPDIYFNEAYEKGGEIESEEYKKGGLIKGNDVEKLKLEKDKIFEEWDKARLKNKKEDYNKTGQSVTESLKKGWAFSENSSRKLVDWINENIFEKQSDEAYDALFYMANSNQSASNFVKHWDNLDKKYKDMLPEMWVNFLEAKYLSSKLHLYRDRIEELSDDKFAKGGKIDRKKSAKKTRINRTKKAIAQDKNIKALHAGKRESESGQIYWESRSNRSDNDRRTKLEKGGEIKLCSVRKDIIEKGDKVPLEDGKYVSKGNFEYRWIGDDEDIFQIKNKGKWVGAESIDFEFDNKLEKGGGISDKYGEYGKDDKNSVSIIDLEIGKKYKLPHGGEVVTIKKIDKSGEYSKFPVAITSDNGIVASSYLLKIDNEKYSNGGDLKNYTSADLPKDGSDIEIHMPEMGKFPAEDIVLKYNQDNFAFDAYRNGELSGTRITEKQVLDNLNNGSYEFKNSELDRYKDFDFDEDGNLSTTVNGKKYKVVYRDDKTQLYDLFEDGKLIKSNKDVRKVMKFEKGGEVEEYAKGGTVKEVDFENSNIIFYGFAHDKNGNSVVKVGFPNQSGFSLQINDPNWFRFTKGKYTKNIAELEPSDVVKIEEEIVEYIRNFGSKKQKESLKVYSKFKGGVRDAKEINALLQDAIRKTKDLSAKEIADMWNANINTEISKSWTEEVSGNISHFRSYLKDLLFEKELTEAEYSEYFEKGGKLGFEGLAKKVAKEYEGDKVKPEYQDEYGKRYDKEEAKEVGQKVAAKVYREQQGMMEKGGEIKSTLSLSEIESKLGKKFGFWSVPYQVTVDGVEYRKRFGSNTYNKI